MRSRKVPSRIAVQFSQRSHGSPSFAFVQFTAFAMRRAMVVLPIPRDPARRYACATCPAPIAFFSVRVTCSCPTMAAKVCGR
jgi:hypothetical protein